MKLNFLALLSMLTLSAAAQAQEPVPLAHGKAPGEPHHHLKIENEYIRAYYVEVPPHESTMLHQHDHDYIYVSLGPSEVVNAVLDKPEVQLQLKDGETHFTRGGFAHVARNLADAAFRNVTIELLHSQENARNVCAAIISSAPPGEICHYPMPQARGFHSSKEFETEEVLDERFSLGPGAMVSRLNSKMNRLLAVYDQSQIRAEVPGKPPADLRGGDLLWLPAGSDPEIRNLRDAAPSDFLLLSFKDDGQGKRN